MDGPACIFWANLTPFSPQRSERWGWMADGSLSAEANYQYHAPAELYTSWLTLMQDVQVGLYPIVTFQYSSTTLYQFFHHIQSLFF